MALLADIKSHLKQSMLDKNVPVRDTLRMLLAEIQRFGIDNKVEVDDAQVLQIINKMVKQRNDSIDQFTKGNRPDLAEIEKVELDILSAYKPAQLDESEIVAKVKAAINETGAESMQDIGKVMGVLKGPLAGSADMGLVSKIVKDQLS
ncbi:MAG: GatB/YqeY domain-containing protein [SAR86 cluster bacterium]|uniref:GatB/YqeY domain-containing protein n=1 Tax=SAR86 cluster bacterium TaxID=2030880 RepID=A0A937JB58_9GAMM|nr:GatB/YqeY domain-containing protein [SAR86 cluster bacterium]